MSGHSLGRMWAAVFNVFRPYYLYAVAHGPGVCSQNDSWTTLWVLTNETQYSLRSSFPCSLFSMHTPLEESIQGINFGYLLQNFNICIDPHFQGVQDLLKTELYLNENIDNVPRVETEKCHCFCNWIRIWGEQHVSKNGLCLPPCRISSSSKNRYAFGSVELEWSYSS